MAQTAEELLKEAQKLNEEEKSDEVIAILEDELLEQYQNADLFAEKAVAYWRLNDYENCEVTCQKSLQIQPENAIANNCQGNLFAKKRDYLKAKYFYDISINADPNSLNSLNNLGVLHYEFKEYEDAKIVFYKAIAVDPKNAFAYNNLGNVFKALMDYEKAKSFYEKAIEIKPRYTNAYNNLGGVLSDLYDYERAKLIYEKALEFEPSNVNTLNNLGVLYYKTNEFEKAKIAFQKALDINPSYELAYNNLGIVYYETKEYELAIKEYKKAISHNPKFAIGYNSLGTAYAVLNRYDEAIKNFKNAIEIDSYYTIAYNNLGYAYTNLKKYDEAKETYEELLKKSNWNNGFYEALAKKSILEINKLIKNKELENLDGLVKEIKNQLLYDGECVTHYTSTSTAKHLLLNNSIFRLSEATYLNDTSEGKALLEHLRVLKSPKNTNKGDLEFPFVPKPFVGSFTTDSNHNDLNLWRLYGKENKEDAKGCSITINREMLIRNIKSKLVPEENVPNQISGNSIDNFDFYFVAYLKDGSNDSENKFSIPGLEKWKVDELNKTIKRLESAVKIFLEKYEEDNERLDLFERLSEILFLFKSAAYLYEHEVRLVVKGDGIPKCIGLESITPNVYIELVSIPPILKRITIGPKVERAEEWAATFYYKLAESNLKPEIVISTLPFK